MVRTCIGAILIVQEITLLTGIVIKGTSESSLKTLSMNLNLSEDVNSNFKNTLTPAFFEYNSIKNKYLNLLHRGNPVKVISPSIVTTNATYQRDNFSKDVLRRNLLSDGRLQLSDIVKPIYEEGYEADINTPLNNNFTGYIYKRPSYDKLTTFKDDFKDMPTYHSSQELTNAVLTLDRFLRPLLNEASFNSPVHLPINPVLALVLSRYGKYIAGRLSPPLYSYMAVNNIHNNKPFGQYKYENDNDNVYAK